MLFLHTFLLETSWNVMAHVQKPDFICWRNGLIHLNWWGRQFIRLLVAKVRASAFIFGSNAGYTMFQSSGKVTGYPLHLPVFPSLPLLCITVCHHISSGVYHVQNTNKGNYLADPMLVQCIYTTNFHCKNNLWYSGALTEKSCVLHNWEYCKD